VGALHAAVEHVLGTVGPGLYGIACSGGADSMALADVAIEVAGPSHVVVLTIDHQLSAGADRVAAEVAAWARARGAAGLVRRVTVEREASIESAARTARYAALDTLAAELGLTAILLGHTARDQAETVLMRILRGTGPAGLAGIPPRREGHAPLLRPFLAIDRGTIDDHVAQRALPIWDDPMNADHAITRVRIRREILPALRRENPQLDGALVRLAASTSEWLAVIDGLADGFSEFPIDCLALAQQPPAVRKRAVARALEAAGAGWDSVHLEAIDALITAPTRGEVSLDLPAGRFVRVYNEARFAIAPTQVVMLALAIPDGCEVRAWAAGDRMRPARLHGKSRKLSDLFADARVPRSSRSDARVIVRSIDETIVWAEHIGIAHDSVITDEEREKLSANPR
jgi:tRNA(Ile)-lysidine synthase